MPYPVQNLIEGQGKPVCVFQEDTAWRALELMIENDYSQLPVVDESQRPLGMVTHESILRGLANFGLVIDQLLVGDITVKATSYSPDDDLFELLDRLQDTNAVLITDGDRRIIGIVTNYDAMEYFRRRAEDLMLVEDIETMLKDLILIPYQKSNGEVNKEKLATVIKEISGNSLELKNRYNHAIGDYLGNILPGHQPDLRAVESSFAILAPKGKQKEFEQLTLSEYISLLFHPQTWDFVAPFLHIDPKALRKLLESVRETRNILAHFRSEITSTQRDQLRFCVDWLDKHKAIPVSWPVLSDKEGEREPEVEVVLSVSEPQPIYSHQKVEREIVPTEEDLGPNESRYASLAIWLRSIPGTQDRVKLTFSDIEKIIGKELPSSARRHRVFWANDTIGHIQSQLWLSAGWRATNVNMNEESVTFARIAEKEKAYIRFFSELLSKLKLKADFPVKEVSPDGQSWVVIASLPKQGPQSAILAYSFSRNKRFRIELYIDTGDKERNKAIFDQLCSQRQMIERYLGEGLNWERIDDKRASRVALYHEGSIDDSKERLTELQEWAVDKMIVFFHGVDVPLTEAAEIFVQ